MRDALSLSECVYVSITALIIGKANGKTNNIANYKNNNAECRVPNQGSPKPSQAKPNRNNKLNKYKKLLS